MCDQVYELYRLNPALLETKIGEQKQKSCVAVRQCKELRKLRNSEAVMKS